MTRKKEMISFRVFVVYIFISSEFFLISYFCVLLFEGWGRVLGFW